MGGVSGGFLCFIVFTFLGGKWMVNCQVNFGGALHKISTESVHFSSAGKQSKAVVLKEVLKKQTPLIKTRFNFGETESSPRAGCLTPLGKPGNCEYITARQCHPILTALVKEGLTSKLLQYLLQAIQSPCGFQGHDFTLCCEDTKKGLGGPSTTSTTSTTKSTTTTSTSTATTTTTTAATITTTTTSSTSTTTTATAT